ncbi:YjzD family protein [Fructobacillus cardui]|uniref:YjzD family protein n=1 Tax=Fructobacillus cardui TaxID=2893170 RepID=UPI00200B763B|nr:YjzD family protein [Fructobacillus cardui]MCK8627087.1 YjzD family protein [Fructobacillus cardui]
MRYITAAFWCALFGEVLGYLVGQMTGVTFNPGVTALVTIIVGEAALILVPALSDSAEAKKADNQA